MLFKQLTNTVLIIIDVFRLNLYFLGLILTLTTQNLCLKNIPSIWLYKYSIFGNWDLLFRDLKLYFLRIWCLINENFGVKIKFGFKFRLIRFYNSASIKELSVVRRHLILTYIEITAIFRIMSVCIYFSFGRWSILAWVDTFTLVLFAI